MFYVYVLKCKDNSLYTGYTNNIEKRMKLHREGKGAKYTRGRQPLELVALWPYVTKSRALRAEIAFKKLSRKEKVKMVYIKPVLDQGASQ